MLHSVKVQARRGTELLDELTSVLPNLYSFNSEIDLDFASTVILLHKYWNDLKAHVEKGNTECRSEFIRILNRMGTLHRKTNIRHSGHDSRADCHSLAGSRYCVCIDAKWFGDRLQLDGCRQAAPMERPQFGRLRIQRA
jgi:hypothetical protein